MPTSQELAAAARLAGMAVDANTRPSTFRGMLYGSSGGGKSTLAAMIMRSVVPKDKLIVDFDTSEGYVSWRNVEGLSEGIKVIPFTTNEDLRTFASLIKNKVPPFDNVGGVILDELSKMTEQDAPRVFEARLAGLYGPKEASLANDQGGVVSGRDHMIALERFRKMYYEIFDNRDIHILAVSHEAETKDRQGNTVSVKPDFSPKIGKNSKEMLHLLARITAETVKNPSDLKRTFYVRAAQVHPTSFADAKCRLNIPTTQVNADDLPGIIRKWFQDGSTETEPSVKHIQPPDAVEVEGKSTTEILTAIENLEQPENFDNLFATTISDN